MSGVFSMVSHWVLQNLPEVVRHEQTGRAHFSAFVVDIFSPRFGFFALTVTPPWQGQANGA
jgi:hypothetical protein